MLVPQGESSRVRHDTNTSQTIEIDVGLPSDGITELSTELGVGAEETIIQSREGDLWVSYLLRVQIMQLKSEMLVSAVS